MRFALPMLSAAVGLLLELPIIAALLRGGYRRYPFVFIYVVADFIVSLVELPSAVQYWRGIRTSGAHYATIYWVDETIIQVLVYLVVTSLLYHATVSLQSRRIVRGCLVLGAAVLAGTSFVVHYTPNLTMGFWMAPWLRDLNFSSAALDLALWALLIGSRDRDQTLLLLSGGLGIQFTGTAIGESLQNLATRSRSRPLSLTGGMIVALANILRLYIWWQALKNSNSTQPRKPALKDRVI
jgi:hypothetical protein